MFIRILCAALLISSTVGCASVMKDKTQPVKVETFDQSGNAVAGAKCVLQNDRGAFNVETPNTVFVRKSAGELVVTCTTPEQPPADAKLLSRVGGAVFGNILLGGGIGAIVDTASGVAFNYPEWVQLVFGKSLIFDRSDFKEAQPTVAQASTAESSTEAATTNRAAIAAEHGSGAASSTKPLAAQRITISTPSPADSK